jgi:hypothetical protein
MAYYAAAPLPGRRVDTPERVNQPISDVCPEDAAHGVMRLYSDPGSPTRRYWCARCPARHFFAPNNGMRYMQPYDPDAVPIEFEFHI